MKAMTCPQCGALIRKISLKDKFAECEYCEARILLADNRDKIVEMPDKTPATPPPTPWEQYQENYRKINERAKQYDAPYTRPQEPSYPFLSAFIIFGVIGLFVLGVFGLLVGSLFSSPPSRLADKNPVKTAAPSPTIRYVAPTPAPSINYQVKVQWNGANDMEHFENPVLENEKLPTLDVDELKKTVFKNRAAQVRVTIGTTGEVTSAEGISGHPVLKEAAVNAAKKTLFNSRAKPATRVLTYYFRLVTE